MIEKVPSFKGGGAYWFTDLTTPDPFYALPILTGLSFLATVEVSNFALYFTFYVLNGGQNYWINFNIFSLIFGFKKMSTMYFLNLFFPSFLQLFIVLVLKLYFSVFALIYDMDMFDYSTSGQN